MFIDDLIAALNSKDLNTPQRRLSPSREKRSLVLRLPPLVPPSFDDDDHFDERQVYNIPRVGKKSTMHDFATNSLSDESLDDEYAMGERERRYMMSGERGGEGVRQVFSKIPRVGRSTRTRRWTHMAADNEERKPWQKDDSFTENQN